ncbi:hypothetical protein KC327_g648 [Hortaea werneckii]|uniref:Mating-type protein MAT-1 n=2 Tax=Hortaea werneckii TaxID=91943 RepID=T1VYT3_HORWE|nr:putative MAT1-1 mating type-1 protein isoform A [Hortaea werneckii]OTA25185.1 hypothetical protein BTJ68_12014 [Hortaea werneckii EXF-2000]KAI6850559.1 hypothetical protein KC358_g635 [Hortaea werneckii]KAI6852523.1 hypothetical protein KC350_g802 [Hortaea werneckii]KAI6944607.1 hypothetical protein KC341_g695 [Hortaea werneckii]
MSATSALPEGLRAYLATCSAEHADQIIQTLREHAGRQVPNAASKMTARKASKIAKPTKKERTKKPKLAVATGGPKRPLNSWMAFRKYYNSSLAPHTQKAISKVLTAWWHADPFEAKWAILAKAYSILRGGRDKDEAPLDEFFRLCAPRIGVIPPEQYQQMMGWQLIPAQEGEQDKTPHIVRTFIPDVDTFAEQYRTTTLSADDLVNFCTGAGYVRVSTPAIASPAAHGALTMAVQPNNTLTTQLNLPANGNEGIDMPLSPWSAMFAHNMQAAMAGPHVGPTNSVALSNATSAVSGDSVFHHANMFDPTGHFQVSFDPNQSNDLADSGVFDAFDPATNLGVDDMLPFDWDEFINEERMS